MHWHRLKPAIRCIAVSQPTVISQLCRQPFQTQLRREYHHVLINSEKNTTPGLTLKYGSQLKSQDVTQRSYYVTKSSPQMSATDDPPAPQINSVENSESLEKSTDDSLEPTLLSAEEIKSISNGDSQIESKIQFILMEHELLRQEGTRVPVKILMKNWPELLALTSKSRRIKFYGYLWNVEMAKVSDKRKRQARLQERLKLYAENPLPTLEEDPYHMTYGLNRNCLHLRLYDTKINLFFHHRIISEMALGTAPLVIDCGLQEHMMTKEIKNCSSQLELVIADNRTHVQPYNLSFCNASPDSEMMKFLQRRIPILYDDDFPLNITEKSYVDIYPRDKLVYLSPHAREEITEFDDDEIYIIGAVVDKYDPRPFSMAKAKKEGIRLKKLPLDTRLDWGLGSKSLTINQMVAIMLEIRATRDWDKALRFIPKRKLIGGRRECPLPNQSVTQSLGGSPRSHYQSSQVFKDYELVAQRRRGFVYQGANEDHRNEKDYTMRRTKEFGRQGFQPRNVKSLMSDMD